MTENSQDITVNFSTNTTMKHEVEQVDMTIQHFRKLLDGYKRNRAEIEFELHKLQEFTLLNCEKLEGEINARAKYLSDTFRNQHEIEKKQLDYLEIQNMTLSEDNKRLIALGESLDAKVRKAENNVGI